MGFKLLEVSYLVCGIYVFVKNSFSLSFRRQEESHTSIFQIPLSHPLSFRRKEESHSRIILFLSFQQNRKRTQKHSKMDCFSKKSCLFIWFWSCYFGKNNWRRFSLNVFGLTNILKKDNLQYSS